MTLGRITRTNIMLCLYILVLFSFAAYNAQGASVQSTNDVVFFSDRLENIIKKKCLKNADVTKSDEALDELHHFIHCWHLTLPKKTLVGEDLYNYCIQNSKNFTSYLETFVEKITPCLEAEEQYLEQFILDSYGAYNHYLCRSLSVTGSSKTNQNQCIEKFDENPEIDPLVVCYKNSQIFGNTSALGLITKTKLCDDIASIQTCYEEIFDEHCPNSPEIKNLRIILTTQALEVCAD